MRYSKRFIRFYLDGKDVYILQTMTYSWINIVKREQVKRYHAYLRTIR